MAGRYTDWRHTHVLGASQEAGAPYLGEARKLLGEVFEQAEFNGLGTHKMRRVLRDGTVIIAEKHGEIPRMTIVPALPPQPGIPPTLKEAFVVWARDTDFPDGIDEDHPQQILRPSWQTFFFDTGVEGYDDFDRKKGTYRFSSEGVELFPDGVRHAGNVDWTDAKGVRLSWYGPSTRYWYDPFVQMVAQYGRKVFLLGQVVLDTDQYIDDSDDEPDAEEAFDERYVLGAGMRDGWLYVVQVQAQNLSVPPPDPVTVTPPGSPYYIFSVGYTPFGVDTVICRYRLGPRLDTSPGFRVVSKSREVLWSGSIERGVSPWFFNPDCTEAITFIPPEIQGYGSSTFVPTFDSSTLQKVVTLDHDEEDSSITPDVVMTDTAVSLVAGGGEAPIAADYLRTGVKVEITIRRRNLGLPDNAVGYLSQRFDIVVAGAAVELRSLERTPSSNNNYDTRRWVMWADAREGVLVCRRQDVHFLDPPGSEDPFVSDQIWLEVWLQGVRVIERTDGRTDVTADNNSFGTYLAYNTNVNDHQSDSLGSALAPLLPIYGWCWGHSALFVPHIIAGAHAGFCYLPRQPAHVFGYTLIGRITSGGVDIPSTVNIYDERVNAPPEAEKLDFDAMDIVLGAAAHEGIVVLSAYPKGEGLKPADHVVLSPPGTQLPELTGVVGDLQRYHPVWLLGQPPPGALA